MKLAAYLRVSTQRQVEDGMGLDVQKKAIRRLAKDGGHRIISWHSDEGISGANGVETRVGLYDAIEAIKEKAAEGLVVYNLDRLARKLEVQEAILGRVWEAKGHVLTVEDHGEVAEDDPDDPMRTAMRKMRGVFSELERGLITKRMREGRRNKAEEGGYAYGAPPFGYRAVNRQLLEDDDEQVTLSTIHSMRAEGKSLRDIAAVLEAEGRKTKRGNTKWDSKTLSVILRRDQDGTE